MKLTKRGTAEFIIGIMIVLIAFFLIAGMLLRFTSKVNDKEAEILCHASIAVRTRSAIQIGESAGLGAKLVPAICQTIDKKISGKKEELMTKIADKMATCWWMFGEGRYEELLHSWDLNLVVVGTIHGNKCFNCYTMLIDETEIENGQITRKEMEEFLMTHNYAKIGNETSKVTYFDYIQSYGGPGRTVMLTPDISPRQGYAISIMPKNRAQSNFWEDADNFFSPSSEGIPPEQLIKTAYAERDVSSIYIGPITEAQELCGSGDISGQ
ncbi:MAG: hypothetical protein AABX05_04475 [Nanoarchaeota archaeon]